MNDYPDEMRKLEHGERLVASEIVRVQRAAYSVEAALIGSTDIPALRESIEDVMASRETFLGAFVDGRLVGVISWERAETWVDVCRLAVDPDYMRRGLGRRLLLDVMGPETRVQTGAANEPAIRLYESVGFQVAARFTIGLLAMVRLERRQ